MTGDGVGKSTCQSLGQKYHIFIPSEDVPSLESICANISDIEIWNQFVLQVLHKS